MRKFWTDELTERVVARHAAPYVVSDWKTPSGRIHVGALRGVLLHDAVARALRHQDHAVRYVFGFDDFDPLDGVPNYLDQAAYASFLGKPTVNAPAPAADGRPKDTVTADDNFARWYADEFEGVYRSLGVESETLRSSELYRSGELNPAIQLALDHAADVRAAYAAVIAEHRSADRRAKAVGSEFPLNVVCEACGRIATTAVTAWDGVNVTYDCRIGVVPYVDGCGHGGSVAPFDGHAKLPWKVEWAAKWFYLRTDVEGAGKDHYTKGGSHDVAQEIFRRVYAPVLPAEYADPPEDLFYEWLYLGGAKMSTSRGVGASAKEVADQIPSELLRFLMVRTKPKSGVDFDPTPDTIGQLFDEYDRVLTTAIQDSQSVEAAIMRAAVIEVRTFSLSGAPQRWSGQLHLRGERESEKVLKAKERPQFVVRFSKIVSLLTHNAKSSAEVKQLAEVEKGSPLTPAEQHELDRRITFAQRFTAINPEAVVASHPPVDDDQRGFLQALVQRLTMLSATDWTPEHIRDAVYQAKNATGTESKRAFQGIYWALLGAEAGPRVGDLFTQRGRDTVLDQLRKALA